MTALHAEPEHPGRVEIPAGRRRSIVLYSPDRDFCLRLCMVWKDEFEIVTTSDDDMIFNLVQSIQPDILLVEAQPTVKLQRKFEFLKSKSSSLRIVILCPSEIKDAGFSQRLRRFVDAMYTEPIDIVKFGKSVQSMEWM